MPTVGARIADRVDALVLVGGGGQAMQISGGEGFEGQPVRLTFDEAIDRAAVLDEIATSYFRASTLDPLHTAPVLRDHSILMLNATGDTVVPKLNADLLHEQLGEPARYLLPFGHSYLFWRLPAFADEIADWLELELPGRIVD